MRQEMNQLKERYPVQEAFRIMTMRGNDFVYVRLHGPGDAYQEKYDNRTLAGWANAFSTWENQGKESFCYFDNDEKGYAAQNALSLQNMFKG